MKKILKRLLSFILIISMTVSSLPFNVFAYIAEKPESITFTNSSGKEERIDSESWSETFPYGTFAFSNSELTMYENEQKQSIKVYRLGGTKGKATAFISYMPLVIGENGSTSYTNAIGGEDIEILVEDPSPDAEFQPVGRDKGPSKAPEGIGIFKDEQNQDAETENEAEVAEAENETEVAEADSVAEESQTIYLNSNAEADSYQWYANAGDQWKIIKDAVDSALPIEEDYLEYVDIRLEYVKDGETYCTDSYHGEEYIPDDDFYDSVDSFVFTSDYEPTYTSLDLLDDEYGEKYFELTFADGEWVKEIIISPIDNTHSDPNRFATFTIYDCYGGELYDSANTLLLTLLDDEAQEQSIFGFEMTEIYGDLSSGSIKVSVKRTGSKNHLATVDFETADGTAKDGTDYVAAKGILSFYGDVTEQTIEIKLINPPGASAEDTPENIITPEKLTDDEKKQLKNFSIKLSNIKGGEGKDIIEKNKETAEVRLYESGKKPASGLAGLLYDPNATDVSANAKESAEALIPAVNEPVSGTEIENTGEIIQGEITAEPAGMSVYSLLRFGNVNTQNQTVTFSRNDVNNYNSTYWQDHLEIAKSTNYWMPDDRNKVEALAWTAPVNHDNGSIKLSSTDGAQGYAKVDHLAQRFSKIQLNMALKSYSVILWNGFILPRVSLGQESNGSVIVNDNYSKSGETKSGHWRTIYPSVEWKFNMDQSLNAIILQLIETEGRSGGGTAESIIRDGYAERRSFSNKAISIKTHTANDEANRGANEALFSKDFSGTITIPQTGGGVHSKGGLYVGSKIRVMPEAVDAFSPYSNNATYLTEKSGGNPLAYANTTGDITMVWDGINTQALGKEYTINVVYDRVQTVNIDLNRSVKDKDNSGNALTGEALQASQNKTVNDFKNSIGGTIAYGYKEYNTSTRKFEERTGSIQKNQIDSISKSISGIKNLQWINFNLPQEDRILFNGNIYEGNEKIYLSSKDFNINTLIFIYYDSEFINVEKEAIIKIDSVSVYLDGDGDGKISGHMEDNKFILDETTKDQFVTTIDMDTNDADSIFAPVEIDGKMRYKYMKVMYSVIPRSLNIPLGKETVSGQVLPAFSTNITDPESLAHLTKEQKEYRFIEAAKGKNEAGGAEKYLSDNIPFYTAEATKLKMIDFPLGGDASPYQRENGNITWTPDYQGNLLFQYENPEPITLKNTILGRDLDLTTDYTLEDGKYIYQNNAQEKINGYLGSYTGNTVFSLVIREQPQGEDMETLINEGARNSFTTLFDSIDIGGKGTFTSPEGLLHMDSGEIPDVEFNSSEESGDSSAPEGFGLDLDFGLPDISFENLLSFDGMGFSMSGNRICFTVGTPLVGKSNSSTGAFDPLKENFNLKDKFNEYSDIKDKAERNGSAGPSGAKNGGVSSKDYGVTLSVSAAFYWEYDPVRDTFVFSEAALGVTGAFEFTLKYRFAPCPLIYIYLTTGISVGAGVGIGREYVEIEEDTPASLYEDKQMIGSSVSSKENFIIGDSLYFNTTAKALNLHFSGKIFIQLVDENNKVLRKGAIISTNKNEAYNINLDRLTPSGTGEIRVEITALENSSISSINEVKHYEDVVYFSGFTLSPAVFIEVGAGIGIELAKIEAYIKVSVEATFLFGGYEGYDTDTLSRVYKGAEVDSFDFMASIGIRVVSLLFSYEFTGLGYTINYDGKNWSNQWITLNSPQSRSFSLLDADTGSKIKPPQSAAGTQQLYSAVPETEAFSNEVLFSTYESSTEDTPFQLSQYNESAKASKLADGLHFGYSYKLVTDNNRNFIVYTYSRAGGVGLDASQIVLSELVEGVGESYGLKNPANPNASTPYIVIDDDGTGDLDFNVYAKDGKLYIAWLNYKEAKGNTKTSLQEAAKNIELKRAVYDIASGTVEERKVITEPTETASLSHTLDKAVAYAVPEHYTPAGLTEAKEAYGQYLEENYDPSLREFMMNTWLMQAETLGSGSKLKLSYFDEGSSWKMINIAAPANQRITNLQMTPSGDEDTYWLSYIAEGNTYDDGDYVTVKKLYMAEVNLSDPTPAIDTKIIRTIMDYDLTNDKDGLYEGTTPVTQKDNPSMGNIRFLKGRLGNSGSEETFFLFDFCENTYLIREAAIEALLAGNSFDITPFFETTDGQASGKTEVNIGVDGAGNVSAVYVSTIPSTSNNALFVSKYDTDTEAFGKGQMLAMRHMKVYEDSYGDIGRNWSEKELEAAYYGELEGYNGGSLDRFTFSNIQFAYGKQETNDHEGKLLVLSEGILSELESTNQETKILKEGTSETGFYALNFGVGKSAIGEQQLKFFLNKFEAGSVLSPELSFKNTGDLPFRASEDRPARVSLNVSAESGTATELITWEIKENIAVGEIVNLQGETLPLPGNLAKGSMFYTVIKENDFYSEPRTASTSENSPFTLEEKMELSLDTFSASVSEVKGNDITLHLDLSVSNTGDKNSEDTYVQFSYKTEELDSNGNLLYKPLDIRQNTLDTASGQEEHGIIKLQGGLSANSTKPLTGTITITKAQFNAAKEGSFNLKAEIYDGSTAVMGADKIIISNADEYNLLNNYTSIPILPKTMFTTADNIKIPMGNTYKMPVGLNSTSESSRVSAEEFLEGGASLILGTIYYDYSGYINMMGSREGSGIMRIADAKTNDFKDIAFSTAGGDGINIYKDNGIFTFLNKDNSKYNPELPSQHWEFKDSIPAWGVQQGMPLRGDFSVGQKDASVTYDTFANKLELYFYGDITVYSDTYPGYQSGRVYQSDNLFAPITINFSDERLFHSHKVTIKAKSETAVLDKLVEHYAGDVPTPVPDKGAPAIFHSRSLPETASILTGEKFNLSVYVYDESGLATINLDSEPIHERAEKISDTLWKLDLEFSENGAHQLSATDKSGNTSYSSFSLDCFQNPIDADAVSDAPAYTWDIVNASGHSVTSSTKENIYLKVSLTESTDSTEAYWLKPSEEDNSEYTEEPLTKEQDGKFKISANGIYRVKINNGQNDSWSQIILNIDKLDTEVPVVLIKEETEVSFADAPESQRHLYYYASKASQKTALSTQKKIISIEINDEALPIEDANTTIWGYYPISYGGEYSFKAFDEAGNEGNSRVEINDFNIYSEDGFILQAKPVTSQLNNNGSVYLDFSKVSGGNYAGFNAYGYYGSYEAAIVRKEAAFQGDLSSEEAKVYLTTLEWGSDELIEGLSSGDYILYLRDKTDASFERNSTISTFDVVIGSKSIAAKFEITPTYGEKSKNGKVLVYPESDLENPEYQAALVYRDASKPADMLAPKDIDSSLWKEVTDTYSNGQAYIGFNGLASGWYQLYLKTSTMDLVADANDIYTVLLYINEGQLAAQFEVTPTYGANSKNGKILAYPESDLRSTKYQAALVYRDASKPADMLAPETIDLDLWKEVTDSLDGKTYIEFNGLTSGWYQFYLKTSTMDLEADANDIYTVLLYIDSRTESRPTVYPSRTPKESSVSKKEEFALQEDDETVTIIYPGAYYPLDSEMDKQITLKNKDKKIIIKSKDLLIQIPAGVLEKDGINQIVVRNPEIKKSDFSLVAYTNADGDRIFVPFSLVSDKIRYITQGEGTYEIIENIKTFKDTENHWAKSAIHFMAARELFSGIGPNEFGTDHTMTRAMFVTVLGRLSGIDTNQYKAISFNDIDKASWYTPYVEWASKSGIISGYGNEQFGPNDPITREQICLMMNKYIHYMNIPINTSLTTDTFTDSEDISPWAKSAVEFCSSAGLISGMDDKIFSPKDNATRAQVATILTNLITKAVSQ